jgi:hypothetical protein
MIQLQKKAHVSLSEYQSGVSSPLTRHGSGSTSEPPTPVHEDELATLGGKTRLVAKTEPATPPLRLSPPSHSPVAPLPLSPTNDPHVHPNVVEYLRTFVPTPEPESMIGPSTASQFSDNSMYSMSSMTGPFDSDTNLFQQPHYHSHSHPHSQSPSSQTLSMDIGSFPQYFPVYDYGPSGDNGANPPMQMDVSMTGPMGQPIHGLTPEANMHATWNEFVTGLGMAS